MANAPPGIWTRIIWTRIAATRGALTTRAGLAMSEPLSLPSLSAPVKHSVTIGGHRTSVSLEEPFWRELKLIARRRGETTATLIAQIDHRRPADVGLATALRLYVLAELRQMLAAPDPAD